MKTPNLIFENFVDAGNSCNSTIWTDDELKNLIECTTCVGAYLHQRGGFEFIVGKLNNELFRYGQMLERRKKV
jgi:hypothetical protein